MQPDTNLLPETNINAHTSYMLVNREGMPFNADTQSFIPYDKENPTNVAHYPSLETIHYIWMLLKVDAFPIPCIVVTMGNYQYIYPNHKEFKTSIGLLQVYVSPFQ